MTAHIGPETMSRMGRSLPAAPGAVLVGVVLGVCYVLLTGMLAVQVDGWRGGATLNLNNELAAFGSRPFTGLLVIPSALVGAVTFYAVVILARAYRVGFVAAVLALIVYSYSITTEMTLEHGPRVGFAHGWRGWVQEAGGSPAVHLLVVLVLGSLVPFLSRPPRGWAPSTRRVVWAVAGAVLGTTYVLLTGLVAIQTWARERNVVLDLNNLGVRVQEPGMQVLILLVAGAFLSATVFWAVAIAPRGGTLGVRIAVATGFLLPVIVLVLASFLSTPPPPPEDVPHVGFALGWRGWAHEGGAVDAVHLLVALVLGSLVSGGRRSRAGDPP